MNQLSLSSPSFDEGDKIPRRFTGDGENVSPPLEWENIPEDTESLVLICDDPDAPGGRWVHWVLYNIPPARTHIEENIPLKDQLSDGSMHAKNSWERTNYIGPSPPPGPEHRYFFKLFALDKTIQLSPGASVKEIESEMADHILGKAELMVVYGR
ncbi:MAG: YbhB/YbcL family Raf kinase inhibitor-like protein [Vulcanimicrobiota bacterium]